MVSAETPKPAPSTLSLEPLGGEAAPPPDLPAVKFHANTRSKTDRRVQADRRELIRFQADRRKADRRPKSSWEPGSNL